MWGCFQELRGFVPLPASAQGSQVRAALRPWGWGAQGPRLTPWGLSKGCDPHEPEAAITQLSVHRNPWGPRARRDTHTSSPRLWLLRESWDLLSSQSSVTQVEGPRAGTRITTLGSRRKAGGPRGHVTRQVIQLQSSHADLNMQPANPGPPTPVCTCCAASARTTPPAPFPVCKVRGGPRFLRDHFLCPHSALRGPLRPTPYLCGLKTGQSSLRRPQTPKPARRTEKERV